MKLFLSKPVSVCMVSITERKDWRKEAVYSEENNVDNFNIIKIILITFWYWIFLKLLFMSILLSRKLVHLVISNSEKKILAILVKKMY